MPGQRWILSAFFAHPCDKDIFCIFNLSFANSQEIYDDSLWMCFNGLYSNQFRCNDGGGIFIVVWQETSKVFFFFIGMGNERTLRESFVVGGFIFTKHALIKINNKSFFFFCACDCNVKHSQSMFYGRVHLHFWPHRWKWITSFDFEMKHSMDWNWCTILQFFENKKTNKKKNEENFLKKKINKRNQMKTDFVRSN